jgi:dolichol-phosphate mannosyltransferase
MAAAKRSGRMNDRNQPAAGSLSVMIMAYNEAATIEAVVREIESHARTLCKEYELVIIDDGSTDGTGLIADQLAATMRCVRVIHHPTNLGLGYVKRTGYREARYDWVTFFPADGECPAVILDMMVPLMSEYDMVLGYIPERTDSWKAIFLAKCERLLIRLLFGNIPEFCGIYMFRRELLNRLPLTTEGRGWMIQMELIIRAHRAGCRMISVPTPMRLRTSGTSKVNNLNYIIANLAQLAKLFLIIRFSRRAGDSNDA